MLASLEGSPVLCKPMGVKKCRFKDMHPKGGLKNQLGVIARFFTMQMGACRGLAAVAGAHSSAVPASCRRWLKSGAGAAQQATAMPWLAPYVMPEQQLTAGWI